MKRFSSLPSVALIPAAMILMAEVGSTQQSARQGTLTGSVNASPTGWVGVSMQSVDVTVGGKAATYPVIMEIVPDSPADSAGLLVGDTILKYDNVDALLETGFKPFLQPGRHVRLTVRHNNPRVVTVVIGKKHTVDPTRVLLDQVFDHAEKQDEDTATNQIVVSSGLLCPLTPIAAPTPKVETTLLAGASLVFIDADLATLLHTPDGGVFVLKVAPGTLAKRSGLKGGDVILRVNRIRVHTPAAVIRIVAKQRKQGKQELTLAVVRDGKPRKITLRK
jgi:S1-C subfamily serine protease